MQKALFGLSPDFDGGPATLHLLSVAYSGPTCPSLRNSRKKLLPPCGASQTGISQMSQKPMQGEADTVVSKSPI